MQEIIQLPLQVQATLVAGYLGYIVLKRDYRKTEKSADMWLLILVLGLPTAIIVQLCDSMSAYLSVFIAPILAFIWVKWLDSSWRQFLYHNQVSHRLNEGDTWNTLSSHKGVVATQITLTRKDGSCYLCQSTARFNDEPFAPFVMDDDGIAFYVTDFMGKDDKNWETVQDVKLSPEYGSLLTYFPREDIKFLEMRFTKQTKNHTAATS